MLRRVGSSASSVICRSFLSKPLIEASYASMHNNPLSNYMNEDGMVPIINESNIGSRSTKISIQYVNPEDAPKTDAEMFTTKDYPEDYFTAPVVNWDREFQSTVSLPKDIFGEVLRTDIIHRCVLHRVYQRRSQDGVKPTKVLRFGMRSALSAKYALGHIAIIDNIDFNSTKTKDLSALLRKNKWSGDKVMFLHNNISKELRIASHNIPYVYFSTVKRINIWDLLSKKLIVMTPESLTELQRLSSPDSAVRRSLKITGVKKKGKKTNTKTYTTTE